MDAAESLLCVLLGSALTVLFVVLVVRRGLRPLSTAQAYRELSGRLGLQVDTRGISARGYLGRRRLWIGSVMEGFGVERRTLVRGVLTLERPLGLGLLVRRKGLPSRVLGRFGPERGSGDRALDRIAHVHGDDRARLMVLLTEELRQALTSALARWPELEVTDRDVRVHLRRPESDPQRLYDLVQTMIELASALEEARDDVPAPEAVLPWVAGWEPVARALELEWQPSIPAMRGELRGRPVLAAASREARGYEAMVRLWFGPHTEVGLVLRPQIEPGGPWSSGQDIEVGHAAFDDAFVIKGYDPDEVRSYLGPGMRQRLLQLAERGRVVVDDRVLEVRRLSGDPEELQDTLRAVAAIAVELSW